ncbi:MAG: hypothetical protein CL609_02455 [Anaerolineaceae bacterium]|nr:hypothetical protein [Anaerolineaceae bacterium]
MEDLILSLDIGTTIIKCVLFNKEGQERMVAEKRYHLIFPQPDYVEIDPAELWSAVQQTINQIVSSIKTNEQISALVVTTQGGSVLPVDQYGQPTHNLITWLDKRAKTLVQQWNADGTSKTIRKNSGWNPQPGLPLVLIAWLRQNNRQVFQKSAKWLSVNDFIIHKLTGNYVTNPSMAGEMLLVDIQKCVWHEGLCKLAGINPSQLSPIMPSSAIVGKITDSASKETTLPKGLPVVNGGQDHACEAIAFGAINAKNTILACGTAWVINIVKDEGSVDTLPNQMDLNFHVLPDKWIASQFLGELGSYPEWILRQFWSSSNTFDDMNLNLLQKNIIHENLFFLPLNGSRQLDKQTNYGGFIGAKLNHDRVDLSKAVLENAAFEVRWALEQLKETNHIKIQKLWMIGGATRSPVWPNIIADINELEIILTAYAHGPALGAAILGMLSLGFIEKPDQFFQFLQLEEKIIKPNKSNSQAYSNKYIKYQTLTRNFSKLLESDS